MILFDTALRLLDSGKPVFPVGRDKKPLINWKPYQNRLPTEEKEKAGLMDLLPSKPENQ